MPLSQAWLTGCFMRSLVLGRRVVRFRRLARVRAAAVFYTALVPPSPASPRWPGWRGGGVVALVASSPWPGRRITADAIGIDELGIPAAIRPASPPCAAARPWRCSRSGSSTSPARSWPCCSTRQIADAEDVFPLFLVAAALASGVRAYVADCALITFYLGGREL